MKCLTIFIFIMLGLSFLIVFLGCFNLSTILSDRMAIAYVIGMIIVLISGVVVLWKS